MCSDTGPIRVLYIRLSFHTSFIVSVLINHAVQAIVRFTENISVDTVFIHLIWIDAYASAFILNIEIGMVQYMSWS